MKIRELLWTLNTRELFMLEKLLCSIEESSVTMSQAGRSTCQDVTDLDQFVCNFYTGYPNCKDFIADFYTVTRNNGTNMDEVANDALLILNRDRSNRSKESKRDRQTSSVEPQNLTDTRVSDRPPSRHNSSGSSDFYSNSNSSKPNHF